MKQKNISLRENGFQRKYINKISDNYIDETFENSFDEYSDYSKNSSDSDEDKNSKKKKLKYEDESHSEDEDKQPNKKKISRKVVDSEDESEDEEDLKPNKKKISKNKGNKSEEDEKIKSITDKIDKIHDKIYWKIYNIFSMYNHFAEIGDEVERYFKHYYKKYFCSQKLVLLCKIF